LGGRPRGAGTGVATVNDAEALLGWGTRAQEVDGDLQASRRWFEAAYREGEQAADVHVMASAVLGLGGLWVHEHRGTAESCLLQTRLRHVLSLVDPTSALALRLRVRLAGETDYGRGEHATIMAALDEARASPDCVVRTEALSLAHHCLLGPDHGALRRALADELVGEAAHAARRGALLMGLLWRAVDAFLDADPHAERRLQELRVLLADEEHLAVGFVVQAIEVMLSIRAGRLAEAEQLAHKCFELGSKAGDVDATGWYGAQLVAIRWYQGRLPELLPMLIELVDSSTLSAVDDSFVAAFAVAAAEAGDHHTAGRLLARLRGRSLADLPRSSSWLVTMYGVIEAANRLGNATAAARAYELLRPFADLPMTASLAVTCFGSVNHALGVAALTVGDMDRAVAHLREAVHRNLALGHWPAVVVSRLRYLQALALRGQPGDEVAAAEQRAKADEEAVTFNVTARVGATIPRSPAGVVSCARHGRKWRVEMGARAVLVDHGVGMLHLAVLTANPGVEILAIDLAAGVDALGLAARGTGASVQPIHDRTAINDYRRRLSQLSGQIDDLEANGDRTGAARGRAERDWLVRELAASAGLGGRSRGFVDNKERARIAVGRAIRRALTQIERADAVIGIHLRSGVHTGVRCWYRPV
jgi:hypothetical protein